MSALKTTSSAFLPKALSLHRYSAGLLAFPTFVYLLMARLAPQWFAEQKFPDNYRENGITVAGTAPV
jgi:hypothetical protein